MATHRFIDGIGEVRLSGGMIRIDLITLSAAERDEEGNPLPEVQEQLVLAPEGFMQMFGTLANTIQQMEEDGLLVAADDADSEDAPAEAPAAAGSGSPNFG
ncbi:MAG: hypothetical protein AAF458_03535 [Pseudomonadota bacterium]